jgi:hypothetical protein
MLNESGAVDITLTERVRASLVLAGSGRPG